MKRITRIDSAFGGVDFYDESGQLIGFSVPGIGGGEDFYGVNGETAYSVPVIGGGEDIYVSDGKKAYTVDGLFGGKDIYGDVSGFSVDSPFGGTDSKEFQPPKTLKKRPASEAEKEWTI